MSQGVLTTLPRRLPYICSQCLRRSNASTRRAFHISPRSAKHHSSVLSILEERGYVNQIAGDRNVLENLLRHSKLRFYAGVDPTAPSLHLGHLLPLMVLFWVSLYGHNAVSLVGGGTARVGDPSGRLVSREQTTESVQRSNAVAMFEQTSTLWRNVLQYAERHGYEKTKIGHHEVLDNGLWLDKLNILDFLKAVGNGMRLGTMLGRETVRNKMEKGDGMSFSEFTYPLLQAWDWWHMYHTAGVQIQIGGSDQYGNIVAGMDAVRYIAQTNPGVENDPRWLDDQGRLREDAAPMGLTVPLLTTARGVKFGKSAGNAIWLDRRMTSSFDLYGFLLRSSDEDVERYLKLFTFVPTKDIQSIMFEHTTDPGRRKAQHLLASEVLEMVHGREEALNTRRQHESLRNPSLASTAQSVASSSGGTEANIRLAQSLVLNTPIARILYHAGVVPSRSAGARLVEKGGIYIASRSSTTDGQEELIWAPVKDPKLEATATSLVDGVLMLRMGKWKVRVIELVEDDRVEHADEDAVQDIPQSVHQGGR